MRFASCEAEEARRMSANWASVVQVHGGSGFVDSKGTAHNCIQACLSCKVVDVLK